MYTIESLVGVILWMVMLILLIGINFRWHHSRNQTKGLFWFHLGSVFAAIFLMINMLIIIILDLPMKVTYERLKWVSLLWAVAAYGMAGKSFLAKKPDPGKQEEPAILPEAVFQSMEDRVFIFDSDFNLTAVNRRDSNHLEAEPVGHLKEYLHQFSSEITQEQTILLEEFFGHKKHHQSFTYFKLMIQSLKSYVMLSKVIDPEGEWVGTVMLMHQADEEIELIESIEMQNRKRLEMNKKLEASLQKLEQFGCEEEKDRLLREINQSIIEGTNQYIHEIQAIQGDQRMTVAEKKVGIAAISQGVGHLYKNLRHIVRQMSTKDQVVKSD